MGVDFSPSTPAASAAAAPFASAVKVGGPRPLREVAACVQWLLPVQLLPPRRSLVVAVVAPRIGHHPAWLRLASCTLSAWLRLAPCTLTVLRLAAACTVTVRLRLAAACTVTVRLRLAAVCTRTPGGVRSGGFVVRVIASLHDDMLSRYYGLV